MKRITSTVTLIAIVVGGGMVFLSLFHPVVGLVMALLLMSPLFVTLSMSRSCSGFASQMILLASAVSYLGYFIYINVRNPSFQALMYSVPVMVFLWFLAAYQSPPQPQVIRVTRLKENSRRWLPGRLGNRR